MDTSGEPDVTLTAANDIAVTGIVKLKNADVVTLTAGGNITLTGNSFRVGANYTLSQLTVQAAASCR
jgi:hypothetical protein